MTKKSRGSLERRGIRAPTRPRLEKKPVYRRQRADHQATGAVTKIARHMRELDSLSVEDAMNAEMLMILGSVADVLEEDGWERRKPASVAVARRLKSLGAAIMEGASHPLLMEWERNRKPNRPWATSLDDEFRALCCDMSGAYQAAGLLMGKARERVVDLANTHGRFGTGLTIDVMNKWEPAHRTANPDSWARAKSYGAQAKSADALDEIFAPLLEQATMPLSRWTAGADPLLTVARQVIEEEDRKKLKNS